MISIEDFHQDLIQSVLSDSDSRGLFKDQAFFENVCQSLMEAGELTNDYTSAPFIKRGLEVAGFDYDSERGILSLFVNQFFQDDVIQTLTKNMIETKLNRLQSFFSKCLDGIFQDMEEAYDYYSMAYNIFMLNKAGKIDKVRLMVFTDGRSTRTLSDIPNSIISGINVEFRIIDISYLYNIFLSQNEVGQFEVNLKIPALKIDTISSEYESYLAYFSGEELVNIYEQFGQKLFEQNVRTFLQFRGNVNKGIRNTIETNPDMFFAYNNGITATASEVYTDEYGYITKIINFQIVNGGQTTSSIYAAKKNSKLDVSNVYVQMKLSVVNNSEKQDDFVSKVSEYANTQNKINKSDFFSNSPFHKEFKNYSKQIWVAASGGGQRRTKWFYERVRGEYLNEQAYLTKSEKDQFKLENPKEKVIDKTFLAKSENSWLQKPHIVSKGSQYSFAEFAKEITDQLEIDNLSITEKYFKEAVSRVILFQATERIVSKAEWYNGGLRAQTVTYTIAYYSHLVAQKKKFLNFNLVWELQSLPSIMERHLEVIAENIYNRITAPPAGNANPASWCRKAECWHTIRKLEITVDFNDKILLDSEEEKFNKKEAKKEKQLSSGIEIQAFVVSVPVSHWKKLYDYFNRDKKSYLSSVERGVLESIIQGRISLPTEAQSKVLYKLYDKAISEGYILENVVQ